MVELVFCFPSWWTCVWF